MLGATAERDLDGRTVHGLQARQEALSETYRDKTSDLALLGLDPAHRLGIPESPTRCAPHEREHTSRVWGKMATEMPLDESEC